MPKASGFKRIVTKIVSPAFSIMAQGRGSAFRIWIGSVALGLIFMATGLSAYTHATVALGTNELQSISASANLESPSESDCSQVYLGWGQWGNTCGGGTGGGGPSCDIGSFMDASNHCFDLFGSVGGRLPDPKPVDPSPPGNTPGEVKKRSAAECADAAESEKPRCLDGYAYYKKDGSLVQSNYTAVNHDTPTPVPAPNAGNCPAGQVQMVLGCYQQLTDGTYKYIGAAPTPTPQSPPTPSGSSTPDTGGNAYTGCGFSGHEPCSTSNPYTGCGFSGHEPCSTSNPYTGCGFSGHEPCNPSNPYTGCGFSGHEPCSTSTADSNPNGNNTATSSGTQSWLQQAQQWVFPTPPKPVYTTVYQKVVSGCSGGGYLSTSDSGSPICIRNQGGSMFVSDPIRKTIPCSGPGTGCKATRVLQKPKK